jgi:hypothetical protein
VCLLLGIGHGVEGSDACFVGVPGKLGVPLPVEITDETNCPAYCSVSGAKNVGRMTASEIRNQEPGEGEDYMPRSRQVRKKSNHPQTCFYGASSASVRDPFGDWFQLTLRLTP